MGVRYVWVLDPLTKRAFCYTPGEMHEVLDGVLRTNNPDVAVPSPTLSKNSLFAAFFGANLLESLA
jgi:hypothetical protein